MGHPILSLLKTADTRFFPAQNLSRRTGLLRGERSLRDLFTPPVGRENHSLAEAEDRMGDVWLF
jgi:hypothetical protein